MGIPSVITTDQGREFHNRVNSELMKILGIDHRLTTAYYPQANGLDERYNQTLVNSLAKFCQTNRDTWDENLGAVVYAYNTSVQDHVSVPEAQKESGTSSRYTAPAACQR